MNNLRRKYSTSLFREALYLVFKHKADVLKPQELDRACLAEGAPGGFAGAQPRIKRAQRAGKSGVSPENPGSALYLVFKHEADVLKPQELDRACLAEGRLGSALYIEFKRQASTRGKSGVSPVFSI